MHSFTQRIIRVAPYLCLLAAAQAQQTHPVLTAPAPTAPALTAVPRLIRFAGASPLTGAGAPLSAGVMGARFAIYRQQEGGDPVWSEVQNVELDAAGNFVALLGSASNEGVPAELFQSGESRWLEVEFSAPGGVPHPRVLLVSVPYAMKAADAETLGGRPASDYLLAGAATTPAAVAGSARTPEAGVTVMAAGVRPRAENGTTGFIAKFSDATDVVNSVLFENNGLVGFGTTSPNHGLHVFNNSPIVDSNLNGQLYVQNTFATNGQGHASLVLDKGNANASAALSFNTVGVQVWDVGATDDNNFHIRSLGGSNTKPLTIEHGAPANTLYINAGGNTGIGTAAPGAKLEVGGNLKVSGLGNALIFPDGTAQSTALITPHGGTSNTGLGNSALFNNTTGTNNTASGSGALQTNTTGASNTASGSSALQFNTTGSNNTATGFQALQSNTTGFHNTANGIATLQSNTTGSRNTACGEFALLSNTTASGNTAIGNVALSNYTGSGGGNIALGAGAGQSLTSGDNNILIGTQGFSSESTTIRLGDPALQNRAFIAGIRGTATGVANAIPVMIDSNGQLGTSNSSRRFKEDIQDMGEASHNLLRLRPVTYRYKQAYADGSKPVDYGLIAEEVAEIYPDLVVRSNDGQIETVQYQKLTPMLLNEAQRQNAKIAEQSEEIRSLQQRLTRLESLLEQTTTRTASR